MGRKEYVGQIMKRGDSTWSKKNLIGHFGYAKSQPERNQVSNTTSSVMSEMEESINEGVCAASYDKSDQNLSHKQEQSKILKFYQSKLMNIIEYLWSYSKEQFLAILWLLHYVVVIVSYKI